MLRKADLIRELSGEPIALWPEWLKLFMAGPPEASIHPSRERAIARKQGAVSLIPVQGVITPKPSIWEAFGLGTSVQTLTAMIRQSVEDPEVKAIVMDIDSPGGLGGGLTEFSKEMQALRGTTPIVAQANYMAASAAYWIASQADEVVASPSALVGSVGVYIMHVDFSKALESEGVDVTFVHAGEDKVLGNPYEPLSEEGQTYLQGLVDDGYRMFVNDVATGRGVSTAKVKKDFGDGRILTASEALSAGLVDKVRTLSETLSALGVSGSEPRRGRALAMDRGSRECELLADPLLQRKEVTI